jgi:hypothetical protein
LSTSYYIVEISSTDDNLYIAAFSVDSPESLLIELTAERGAQILNEF